MPKTICVDFDGVIHHYRNGWAGCASIIDDTPTPGAFAWLDQLLDDGFDVCIYSSRSKFPGSVSSPDNKVTPSGVEAMVSWFVAHGYSPEKLRFPTEKPAAMMTVDDRAFCFQGTFPAVEWLNNFKPWNK